MKAKISRCIVLIIMVSTVFQKATAQQKEARVIAGQLHVDWEVIINNYQNKPQSLSAVVLTVGKKQPFPAKGWKLYFNFAREIVPASVTGNVQIRHINGDFFCLSPDENFKGIAAGESLQIQFTSTEWLVNRTDAPEGLYLVWDSTPAKTYPITIHVKPSAKPEQLLREPKDNVQVATAATIYAQNKNISALPADSLIKVFPTPVNYQEVTGSFKLDASVKISADPTFAGEKAYLRQALATLLIPANALSKTSTKAIVLKQKPMTAEAYELTVNSNRVTISAGSNAGIFYGIQSLKTLISPNALSRKQKNISIKNVIVKDEPRFPYRAVMLDVARNFQSKQEILKLLDVMSLYKLNVLHFHLTDDEGWRLEIPGLPELTAVGSKRGHTLDEQTHLQPALGSGPDVSNHHGSGYYTQADFMEILKYATQRHINVIPEIESPGHARAAIKAMDSRYKSFVKLGEKQQAEEYLLHDLNDTSKYKSVQYWNDNVVDVALPSTYRFINKITAELVKMYAAAAAPLKTIHFGGDEVPAGAWQGSPAFTRLMEKDTIIHSVDDLWPYYYVRVNDILKLHRLYLTAWEETGLVKATQNGKKVNVLNNKLLNQNVHLEVWNNVLGWGAEDLAYKQANAGYKVILSCVSNLYFDMAYEKSFDEPGYYWGGYIDVDKLFKFIPYNYFKNTTEDRLGNALNRAYLNTKEQLTETGKANIVGLQGALWGETIKGPQRLEYMLLPKLLGLAERTWAADPDWATEADTLKSAELYNKAWNRFVNILSKRELPRLDNYAGGFNYRIPAPGAMRQGDVVIMNCQLPGFTIHYTTDGSEPTAKSQVYTTPIPFHPQIKMALFNQQQLRSGRAISL